MTTIGLQDAATTFVIAPDAMIPFANVGYAGFIGSVSGMNAEKISLGEMGGRGEGAWDGVPMATLMRRGLEECDSLAEVKDLWQNNLAPVSTTTFLPMAKIAPQSELLQRPRNYNSLHPRRPRVTGRWHCRRSRPFRWFTT